MTAPYASRHIVAVSRMRCSSELSAPARRVRRRRPFALLPSAPPRRSAATARIPAHFDAAGAMPPAPRRRFERCYRPLEPAALAIDREADRAADRGDDPEAQDDLRLRPRLQLEVVMDR